LGERQVFAQRMKKNANTKVAMMTAPLPSHLTSERSCAQVELERAPSRGDPVPIAPPRHGHAQQRRRRADDGHYDPGVRHVNPQRGS
jgi:hypothetical protein